MIHNNEILRKVKIGNRNTDIETTAWDFKIKFKHSLIVYYFYLCKSFSVKDIVNYTIREFRHYIAMQVYMETHTTHNAVDRITLYSINKNLSKEDKERVSTSAITINPKSEMIE